MLAALAWLEERGTLSVHALPRLGVIAAAAALVWWIVAKGSGVVFRVRMRGRDRLPTSGGYVLAPTEIEFWQGRPSRLHDRLRYVRQPDGSWKIERLSP